MRTTLTLDDDVAVQLDHLRSERNLSLRDAVNAALRSGLQQMSAPAAGKRKAYKTPVFHAERFLAGDLTSTSEMLAVAEGEACR